MSLFVMTRDTVWNPVALDVRSAPRKLLERIALMPRREAGWRLVARVIFENQLLRYLVVLLPFVISMLVWPRLALPISQAPVPMLIVIGFVELRVLRIPRERRERLCSDAEVAATLDLLQFRARPVLADIAARRNLTEGTLYLVIDQSEMANVAPLTVMTVQTSFGDSRVMALDKDEREMLRTRVFDTELTEQRLHRVNLRQNEFLRSVPFEARSVSAHARLAARLAEPAPTQEAAQ